MTRTRNIRLEWTGEGLAFEAAGAGGVSVVVDGAASRGPSPMEALLMSVGGCMAIDVLVILEKSRVPVQSLAMVAEGLRAEDDPKRYESITLAYELSGPEVEHSARVDRAIELSRDKYCSVLHTLRPDLDVTIEMRLV